MVRAAFVAARWMFVVPGDRETVRASTAHEAGIDSFGHKRA
jgi:hypothetical protein